jgi:hypothetical protein
MAEPVPEPTATQLVTVAEIMMVDADEVLDLVSADSQLISNAKWALTLADITTWTSLVDEANDVKRVGSIEFFENNIGVSRLAFRNKLRQRYGLDLLMVETGSFLTAVTSLEWF